MEEKRILEVYKKRDEKAAGMETFFSYEDVAQLFRAHQRYRDTLFLIKSQGLKHLAKTRILDVGCGNGNMLRQFLQWGADPSNLAGIELRQDTVGYALLLNPNLDVRCGSATQLPWSDGSFDIVCQHTVFSSILDQEMREAVAAEMLRVLSPTGLILWYDFWLNPTNPQTRGLRPKEIRKLFPNCQIRFKKITLAPPIARRLAPISWGLCIFLESLKIFNTHYLAVIRPAKP